MRSVLLDTSFFIRFLNEDDKLFKNVDGYFKYFLKEEIALKCSTISVAEYCVRGKIDELPLKNLQIIPFNLSHAQKAGEFANIVFKNKEPLDLSNRDIIPNDTKLFAQADSEKTIDAYLTSDSECIKIYKLLKNHINVCFEIIDIHNKHSETFGVLDL